MKKLNTVIRNINEGYQPIIKANNRQTSIRTRPTPPKGGSGVPNILRITSPKVAKEINSIQNNR